MNLEIPDGASVQIIVGKAPMLALTDQRADLPAPRGRGFFGTTLKVAGVCALVVAGFWIGEQRSAPPDDAGFASPPPVQQAFPAEAPPASASGQVPSNFTEQLQQPPTIAPAPGQSPDAGNGKQNPFGLND